MKTRGATKYSEEKTQYYTRKDNRTRTGFLVSFFFFFFWGGGGGVKKRQENEISEERAKFKGRQDGKAKNTRKNNNKKTRQTIHLGMAVVSYQ